MTNIQFDSKTNYFYIQNSRMTYIVELFQNSHLLHRYWGPHISNFKAWNQTPNQKKTFAAFSDFDNPTESLEYYPHEFSLPYQGDYMEPSLEVTLANLSQIVHFHFQSYQIIEGTPELDGLPHVRNNQDSPAQTLKVTFVDEQAQLILEHYYTVFQQHDIILRSYKLINLGKNPVTINKFMSASFDIPFDNQVLTSFSGSHQAEFQLQKRVIQPGRSILSTRRGASGPQYPPFLAISNANTDDFSGEVKAMTLIYSGEHAESVERNQYDFVRLQIGLNPDSFSWKLEPNDSFQTPQAVLAYSRSGFNGMSQVFHHFTRAHLVPPQFANRYAPILVNSWEMTYFDVNHEKMSSLISKAAQLGFEAVVLDDGWFLGRENSRSSLGDWTVDKEKFPDDLHPLIQACHKQGLQFGIWFEPEMISQQSILAQEKPHWIVRSKNHAPLYSRHQYCLDVSQKEVQDWLIDSLSQFISTYQVDYIKWDMNRHLVEHESQITILGSAKEFAHRYMLGLYRIIDSITKRFPDLLIENCSSGGGRLDYGMLYYFPQTWASDNTDGLDRQAIQDGASYLFHPYQITGHVSVTPNHQTQRHTPLQTRQDLASATNMGYELNLLEFSEEEEKRVIKHISEYKQSRHLVKYGNFYHLKSPFTSNQTAWLFESQDKSHYQFIAFNNVFKVSQHHAIFKIPYLDQDANYVDQFGREFSGAELVHSGLHIPFAASDFQSYTLELSRVE